MKTSSKKRLFGVFGIVLSITLVMALAGCANNVGATSGNNPPVSSASGDSGEADAASGDDLVIPISGISETATFYQTEVDGVQMEVLAVKASDGTIRTAFNTCDVCYDSGRGYYKQDGNKLVCQNCGNAFTMDQVGTIGRGGCNPYSIFEEERTIDDENVTVPYDFLKESKDIFANWKVEY